MKIDTFTCDTCKRAIDIETNPTGITAFPRCIITANCRGLMSQTRKLFVTSEQYQTSGTSSDAWYQRPMMFNHFQNAPRKVWNFKHNLGTMPILNVYAYNNISDVLQPLDEKEYSVQSLNETSATITFDTSRTGSVQCLVRQSATDTIKDRVNVAANSNQTTRLVYNQSMVLASKQPVRTITLVINSNPQRTVILEADAISLAVTPWIATNKVRLNNEMFNVVAVNANPLNVTNGAVASFWIAAINDVPVTKGDAYILLAKEPYQHPVDKLLSNVLDVTAVNSANQSLTSLVGSTLYCDPKLVVSIYPPMEPS